MDRGAEIGAVKSVVGRVTVENGGDTRVVSEGDPLFERDVVRTAEGASMGATLADGSAMTLGEDSAVEMSAFVFAPGESLYEIVIKVLTGRFVFRSGLIGEQSPESIRIETPQVTVSVRGTRFAVIVPRGDG